MNITPTSNKIPNKKLLTVLAVSIPAVYVTKLHLDMYPQEDKVSRQRMLNKMGGFLGGFGVGILAPHKSIKTTSNIIKIGAIALAATAPVIGLRSAKFINEKFFPKQQLKKKDIQPLNSFSTVYNEVFKKFLNQNTNK